MNILLVIGIIILFGVLSGTLFRKLKLPQIMGYIIVGLFLGKSFHGILTGSIMTSMQPVTSLALGIIGFLIGAEIQFDKFKRYSRSIYTILFAETFFTFFLVAAVTTLLTKQVYIGIMLGALSSATAPAVTYSVLEEYKARGPVTTTALSIVALDDALALLIYGFASVFAKSLMIHETASVFQVIGMPLLHILFSVVLGAVSGYVLHRILQRIRDNEKRLPISLGTIILVVGLGTYLQIEPILACMVLGAIASNLEQSENKEAFQIVKVFASPIFIMFFVLVGARLDGRILVKGGVFVLALVYIISRGLGKISGAYIGGKISGAKLTVTKYLGFCLFDQAGIAVGLAIAAFNLFAPLGQEAYMGGLLIINVITATTFILQLIAPPMIKYGITKADEINRNITEEDIIAIHKVSDVMQEDFFIIKENNNLHQIMDLMKKSDSYHFSVVGMSGDFMGIISLGDIRDTFYEEQLDQLIVAEDIVHEVKNVVYADQDLKTAISIFREKKISYLPVLKKEGSRKLVGQLESKKVMDLIIKELLLRQQEVEG